jgi:hypothetical protein
MIKRKKALARTLALTAAGASCLIFAAGADASPRHSVHLKTPANHAHLHGKVKLKATGKNLRYVKYFVDGKFQWMDRSRPFTYGSSGMLDTWRLGNGKHRLTVKAVDRKHHRSKVTRYVHVKNRKKAGPAKPAPTQPAPSQANLGPATWSSTFESGGFDDWTVWKRDDGGTFYVTDAAKEGIPAHSGSKVAHFEVTASQESSGNYHSKLFQSWAVGSPESGWHDDQGNLFKRLPNNSPAGTYSAWYYLPPNYSDGSRGWVNIMQFKESYTDGGSWAQDPEWWINMSNADAWPQGSRPAGVGPSDPVLFANYNNNRWGYNPKMVAAPRGRWFQIKAELYPGDRIDWYLDGHLFDTSRNSTYPVGIFHKSPGSWTFGIGHYGGVGKLWADDASFTAR